MIRKSASEQTTKLIKENTESLQLLSNLYQHTTFLLYQNLETKDFKQTVVSSHILGMLSMLLFRFAQDEDAGRNPFSKGSMYEETRRKWLNDLENGTSEVAVELFIYCNGYEGEKKNVEH